MISANGRDFYTANEVPDIWPDVSADMVRHWAARGKVNPVRTGGRAYYDFNELAEAEHAARTSRRGKKRGVVPAGQDHVRCDQS